MKILIAGAGHGGLAAAGLLAKNGAQVTVIERFPEENLGHDWTDIFDPACFQEAGIPLPPPEDILRDPGQAPVRALHNFLRPLIAVFDNEV